MSDRVDQLFQQYKAALAGGEERTRRRSWPKSRAASGRS